VSLLSGVVGFGIVKDAGIVDRAPRPWGSQGRYRWLCCHCWEYVCWRVEQTIAANNFRCGKMTMDGGVPVFIGTGRAISSWGSKE